MIKRIVMIVVISFGLFSLMPLAAFAAGLNGTYTLVNDSDGSTPKKGAVVTITFKGTKSGTVSMTAVQPGETVTDTGTFSVTGGTITINFKEMGWQAKKQPFQLVGDKLVLPFKALGLTEGPGTSQWTKQDAAPSNDIETKKQALSGPAKTTDTAAAANDEKQSASQENSQGQLTGLEGKETCAQCKYIPCIKSLIEQKEAMIKAFKTISIERDWGNLEGPPQEGRDYVNDAALSKEAASFTEKTLNEEREQLFSDIRDRIDPPLIDAVKKKCPFSGSGVIMMKTNSTVCNIDQKSIDDAIKAIPCKEIAQYMYFHESYHYTQCLERLKKKIVGILTARGEAQEDVAAYTQEIKMLRELLDKASKSNKGGCWRCGKTQVVHPNSQECDKNCERVHLGGAIMFKCFKLNEKGEHVMGPKNQF
jgi:hypothetical protein